MFSQPQRSTTPPMIAAASSIPWFIKVIGIGTGLSSISLQIAFIVWAVLAMWSAISPKSLIGAHFLRAAGVSCLARSNEREQECRRPDRYDRDERRKQWTLFPVVDQRELVRLPSRRLRGVWQKMASFPYYDA